MYMRIAEAVAATSDAVRLKVGAVAVKDGKIIGESYNGMPRGWETNICEDSDGSTKAECTHCEDNLVRKLARGNESSIGSTVVCTHAACLQCAIKLVDVGIEKFVYKNDYRLDDGLKYLAKQGVTVFKLEE